MIPNLLTAAASALDRAEMSLVLLNHLGPDPTGDDIRRALTAWSDLLLYGNRVFTKLEQGSKINTSAAWFAECRNNRKSDPLMAYMHHARNVDEHGVQKVASREAGEIVIRLNQPMTPNMPMADFALDQDGEIRATPAGKHVKIMNGPSRLVLLDVTDRGVRYKVPETHGGQAIGDASMLQIARLFVAQLRTIICEASRLVPSRPS